VTGWVLNDRGEPLAGAEVLLAQVPGPLEAAQLELEGRANRDASARAISAEDGSYRLETVESGLYLVRVEAAGRVPRAWAPLPLVEDTTLEPVQLELDLGGRVEVVDAAGVPVAGASVRVTPRIPDEDQERFAGRKWLPAPQWVVTDDAGAAAFARDGRADLQIVVAARGYPPAVAPSRMSSTTRLVLGEGVEREVEILEGGAPAPGATLWLDWPRLALAIADERGRASLAAPVVGDLLVLARSTSRATGRARVGVSTPARPDRPLRISLESSRRALGRVVDSETGTPIEGALVYDPLGWEPWTRTDREGFRLAVEWGGSRVLRVAARGYVRDSAYIGIGGREWNTGPLRLERAVAIEGEIVDPEGHPVPGVEIALEASSGFARTWSKFDSPPRVLRTRTDESGGFAVAGMAEFPLWWLSARRAGHGTASLFLEALRRGESRRGVRLVLEPEARLVGRLLGFDGSPVAGAGVELLPRSWDSLVHRAYRGSRDDPWNPRASSDADGRFHFAGLLPGAYFLVATSPGHAPLRLAATTLAAGETRDLGDLRTSPGVVIAGRIVAQDGSPLSGVEVLAISGWYLPRDSQAVAISDLSGRFLIPGLWPGDYLKVLMRKPGFGSVREMFDSFSDACDYLAELHPLGTVSGRVVDAAGLPAAAAVELHLTVATDDIGSRTSVPLDRSRTVTLTDGTFQFDGVESGAVSLMAVGLEGGQSYREGLWLRRSEPLAGITIWLDDGPTTAEGAPPLPRGAISVRGRVEDEGGRPIAFARIRVDEEKNSSFRGYSRGDGTFELTGLAPGRYRFAADAPGFQRWAWSESLDIDGGPLEGLRLVALRGGAISGRVLGVERGELIEVSISARSGDRFARAEPESDGTYRLEGLAAGEWVVRAGVRGRDSEFEGSVTVSDPASEVRLDLVLAPKPQRPEP